MPDKLFEFIMPSALLLLGIFTYCTSLLWTAVKFENWLGGLRGDGAKKNPTEYAGFKNYLRLIALL